MLESIKLGWHWLAAYQPTLPYLLTTLLFYGACYGIRKKLPGVWTAMADIMPFADAITRGEDVVRQFFLAVPQIVLSATFAGLATGDVKGAILGALAGAGAPILHHTRKALPFDPYQGKLGDKKDDRDPPTGGAGVSAVTKLKPPPSDLSGPPSAAFKRMVYVTTFALMFVVGSCVGLAGCVGAAQPAKAPCDTSTLAAMTAECSAQAFQCGAQGIPKNECAPMIVCNERLDLRRSQCL